MGKELLSTSRRYYQAAMLSGKSYAFINMNIKKFRYMNYAYGKKKLIISCMISRKQYKTT